MAKKVDKEKRATAYHEAGHAIACYLSDRKFEYVTIKPKGDTLGQLKRKNHIRFETMSITFPNQVGKFFTENFINGAGFVSEKMYRGRNNMIGAKSDFKNMYLSSLSDLPDIFIKKYYAFLAEYILTVFQIENNWIRLKAIAEALIEKETLTYVEVINIAQNEILKQINN